MPIKLGSFRKRMRGLSDVVPVDPVLTRNASALFAPGHGGNFSPSTSTGATVTSAQTLVNLSGAPIAILSALYIGWMLKLAAPGYTDTGNDVPVSATVEYPVGTVIGTLNAVIPNGGNVETNRLNLATAIPVGASYKIMSSITIASGQKYVPNLGLAGVLTTALKSTQKKECLFVVGDSIMTNNGGFLGMVSTRCPVSQMSIVSAAASSYVGNYARHAALAKALGATRCVSDFSVNDLNAGATAETIRDNLLNLQAAMTAQNILFTQTTQTPQSGAFTVTPTSVTSSGTTMTVVVPDASLFVLGVRYQIFGATQTEYNASFVPETIDLATNTMTSPFVGSATPTATGTITLGMARAANARKLQTPGGGGPRRSTLNDYIRSGIFTGGFIDWGDACELTRNDNIWLCGGESPVLLAPRETTLTAVTSTTRFQSSGAPAGNWGTGGYIVGKTGANRGVGRSLNGANGGDTTVNTAWPNALAVGDKFQIFPGSDSATDDRLHPRVANAGYGGQDLLAVPTRAWLDALL